MKTTIISFFLLTIAVASHSQSTQWNYDGSHAKVGFSVSHFGISEIEGKFTKFDGVVLSDKPDFSDAKIDFTIDAASIDTEQAQRDAHLKSADFFDVAKHPAITFKSKSFTPAGKNKYKLVGDLQMHGVTKEIELVALYKGTVVDFDKNSRAGFKISGVVDRTQFGLVWNGKLASGDLAIGNEVALAISIELIKKP